MSGAAGSGAWNPSREAARTVTAQCAQMLRGSDSGADIGCYVNGVTATQSALERTDEAAA
jgi:hypothetical protein